MIHIHLYILFSYEIMFRLMIDSSIICFYFFYAFVVFVN